MFGLFRADTRRGRKLAFLLSQSERPLKEDVSGFNHLRQLESHSDSSLHYQASYYRAMTRLCASELLLVLQGTDSSTDYAYI